jgi:hypothetical protein
LAGELCDRREKNENLGIDQKRSGGGTGSPKRWSIGRRQNQPDFEAVAGLGGPPGMPANIVKTLDNAVKEALNDSDVISFW